MRRLAAALEPFVDPVCWIGSFCLFGLAFSAPYWLPILRRFYE